MTILTGFLGAGKTTLLNRILREAHGQRIAVIENEFGEEGVDNDLLVDNSDTQILEMNNGCICCTVRGDLIRILGELNEKRSSGSVVFDRVVIETTGLADPAPVAQTFFMDDSVANHYRLDGIVTVVDAKHAPSQLDVHHEAQEQVGFADRILMSKSDLVSEAERTRLCERLTRMNPRAPIRPVHFGQTPIAELLDIEGFKLDDILEIEPDFLTETTHEHDDDVKSFVFKSDRPFDQEALQSFFGKLIDEHGTRLMRYKGVLNVAGMSGRLLVQGVHMLMTSELGKPWSERELRASKLVFIGKDLDKVAIFAGLDRCLAKA